MPGRAITAAVAAVPVPQILVLSRSAAAGASHSRRDGRLPSPRVRQMHAAARRAADAAARGDNTGTALEPPAIPGPAPENQYMLSGTPATAAAAATADCDDGTHGAKVELRRGNCKRKVYADNEDLPLFCCCDEMACQQYMAAIITSINKLQEPCKNFYGFVCDSWKHQHHLISVVDAAEDSMYKRVLDAVERASHNGRKQARNFLSTASVEKKAAALAKPAWNCQRTACKI
ncbi:hypothetical protein HPB51_029292 [Rhipicephalus microplus]|uniref:Uncharacterized protein n=1 Tax=Rhipicephalus microplus TaxID=6941 RepID=A0A9J6CUZ4_RHIMP|nr:hypothetical protein HPB51_029292 [Rhipicephalus microplus]